MELLAASPRVDLLDLTALIGQIAFTDIGSSLAGTLTTVGVPSLSIHHLLAEDEHGEGDVSTSLMPRSEDQMVPAAVRIAIAFRMGPCGRSPKPAGP